jgi:SNF2 family DNA or RNA helicase
MARLFPHAADISGDTKYEDRIERIDAFKARQTNLLISKPKILGFGLNLQIATRQVFSTLQDSYEEFYQAVKRSNRVGSTEPLDVHVPVTEVEMPMVQNVLDKAHRIEQDTKEQEELFKECGIGC